MPRLNTFSILQAYRRDPLLPLLLRECRSVGSARNELHWLRQHALGSRRPDVSQIYKSLGDTRYGWRSQLKSMCRERSRGKPLQYILGNQPFGDLDILCRKDVLIPRSDTESYTLRAARLILKTFSTHGQHPSSHLRPLRVLDLCSGTGCIPLLLHALLAPHFKSMSIVGFDISAKALALANDNIMHNVRLGSLDERAIHEVRFYQGNILDRRFDQILESASQGLLQLAANNSSCTYDKSLKYDILISNPPYVSATSYRDGTTTRSVRRYEPKIALVPLMGHHDLLSTTDYKMEDTFYYPILLLAFKLEAKITVLECGDHEQADRIAYLCRKMARTKMNGVWHIQIWDCDWEDKDGKSSHSKIGSRAVILQRLLPNAVLD
ncbi:hypothetical protein ASPZODRAFT_60282 [Penicilliopsis zonata CBS 506.65]|uniref:Methyltransferase domain-containing protein n=1 Tax=Penicilliopsis zonata CBS 506.65 TaxID=1073090 RepID=A0A1L9SP11_9EURO|nr:hypothetical protein ASPZODRAFT_60282 [Penicilliopsis zonata CBS 506.65]OJJ48767.1 hypothetical protein ASPZODRAFT_60282 [Penicilliopsis zonata CBS 506.65]